MNFKGQKLRFLSFFYRSPERPSQGLALHVRVAITPGMLEKFQKIC